MSPIDLNLLAASVLPRVEDPWPKSIGIGFPFAVSGACGVLAGIFYADAPQLRRDRAISNGGVWGFRAGALFYAISVFAQVVFG